MNKKKCLLFIILINLLVLLSAQKYNLFKYIKLSGVDYYTGSSLSCFSNEDVSNGIDLVKSVEIKKKTGEAEDSTIYVYLNGRVESIFSNIRDGRNSFFKYTSTGYLESMDLQERVYISDNECLLMEDGKTEFKISIEDNGSYKKIQFDRPKSNSTDFFTSQIFEYFYEDNLLNFYREEFINPQGKIYSNRYHIFEYTDKRLINHLVKVNNKIRWKYALTYDENNQLSEVIYTDEENPKNNRRKTFENYDNYGNWLYSKEFYDDKVIYEIYRTINYVKN